MVKQKYDLQLSNPTFDITQDCGVITAKQAKAYIREIANLRTIPQDSCLYDLSVQFFSHNGQKYYLCGNPNYKPKLHKTCNGWMSLKINNKNCRKCATEDCLKNICSGKCTDEFAREIIGKKLFADKYEKQK